MSVDGTLLLFYDAPTTIIVDDRTGPHSVQCSNVLFRQWSDRYDDCTMTNKCVTDDMNDFCTLV